MSDRLLRHPSHIENGTAGSGPHELLDAYLDGLLNDHDRLMFERALQTDAALAEQVQIQREINAAIRVRFSPADIIVPVQQTTASRGGTRQVNWIRVGAIAALTAIATIGIYYYQGNTMPGAFRRPSEHADPGLSFQRVVAAGLKPYEVCASDEAFVEYTRSKLGTALRIRPVAGLAIVGWSYGYDVFGKDTITLMAKLNDKPIVVYMDRAKRKREMRDPCGTLKGDLLTIGDVVLYEVREPGTDSILANFELADPPK